MDYLNQELLENLTCAIFNGKSYYGYKPSILKSAICKCYRRGIFDKLEWSIIEMFIFGYHKEGKALLTNVMNRLKILLMEEIVITEIDNLCKSIDIIQNLEDLDMDEKITKILEFCDIIKKCKRGRIASYVNNWVKYNGLKYEDIDFTQINIDKVKKYQKKGDTDELLKLGELFIQFLETNDMKLIEINNIVYQMEGKFGSRYRRKDALYLLWEIMEDKFKDNEHFQKIFNFAKEMVFRKQMTERRAFSVWICLFVWKYKELDWLSNEPYVFQQPSLEEYFSNRKKIEINEDFIVNDYHVNKKFGLAKFGNIGSLVVDEDLSILGSMGEEYRQFYIDVKNGQISNEEKSLGQEETGLKEKKIKIKKGIEEKEIKPHKDIRIKNIAWCRFNNIKVLEDGVCGLKVCCIRVDYKGKTYILKEMRESFNCGRDYMFLDILKKHFNIKDLGMRRIRSNRTLKQKDKKIKTYKGNWKLEEKESVYCMMENFLNLGDLGKNKRFLTNPSVKKECFKIRLFDGLFRASDNILRNILVNESGELMSIDENDIYGKRTNIFNKTDWCLKNKNKIMIDEILEEFDLVNKISLVKEKMELFDFKDKISEMEDRFTNYKDIVYTELDL